MLKVKVRRNGDASEQIPIADQLSNLTNGFCWIPCAETAKETE